MWKKINIVKWFVLDTLMNLIKDSKDGLETEGV